MGQSFVGLPNDAQGKKVHTHTHVDGNGDTVHTQAMHLADIDNPENIQSVDNQGQGFVRFVDGTPKFDIFGRTAVTDSNLMGLYKFYDDPHIGDFEKRVVGVADAVHDLLFSGLKLTTGTANADSIKYTSHKYYIYRPGNGMPCTFTMKFGDIGKTNLKRCAGLFDDDNGVFFELQDTIFSVIVRDELTGTEDKEIQANWNGDRLDGSVGVNNKSGVTLDLTKNNIWWIEFQYLGAGVVKFGTYVNGSKVTCHTVSHYGTLDRPYMKNASLPFRVQQINTGITGSSSEMHVFCAVVENQGYGEFIRKPSTFSNEKTITSTTLTPILSFRPTQTDNGHDNRERIVPLLVSCLSVTQPIELVLSASHPLTGATFATVISSIEVDTAATALSAGGKDIGGFFLGVGVPVELKSIDLFDQNNTGVHRKADITQSFHWTISARLLSAGSSLVGVRVTATELD